MDMPGKEAPWWVILAAVALEALLSLGAIFGLYMPHITTNVFLVSLIGLVVIVGGLLMGIARLRPRDLGLKRSTILSGLAMTGIAWLALQVIAAAACLVTHGRLVPNALWGQFSVVGILATFVLSQLLGVSLHEEIVWRGFLIPQLALKFKGLAQRPAIRWIVVVLVSQALFALYHIPIQLYTGTSPAILPLTLLPLWIVGILLAIIYIRTGNLFLVIGLHALNNLPLLLFAVPPLLAEFIGALPIVGVVCALAVLWRWGKPRRDVSDAHLVATASSAAD